MRHRVSGKHLNRTPSHRVALRRNLAASLFEHGTIRTTEPKAKDVRRFVEKLITIARKGDLHARRLVIARLQDRKVFSSEGEQLDKTIVQKLFDEIAPRYKSRNGGYTRIIRLVDRRIGDAGRQVLLQLVEEETADGSAQHRGTSRRRARAAKRIQVAAQMQRAAKDDQADEQPPDDETDQVADDQDQVEDQATEASDDDKSVDTDAPDDNEALADDAPADDEPADEDKDEK